MATSEKTSTSDLLLLLAQECVPSVPVVAGSTASGDVLVSREFLSKLVCDFHTLNGVAIKS